MPPRTELPQDIKDAFVAAVLHTLGYENAGPDAWPELRPVTWEAVVDRALWWAGAQMEDGKRAPSHMTPDMVKAFYDWYDQTYPDAARPQRVDGILKHWPVFEVAYAGMAKSRPARRYLYGGTVETDEADRQRWLKIYERFANMTPEEVAAMEERKREERRRYTQKGRRNYGDL